MSDEMTTNLTVRTLGKEMVDGNGNVFPVTFYLLGDGRRNIRKQLAVLWIEHQDKTDGKVGQGEKSYRGAQELIDDIKAKGLTKWEDIEKVCQEYVENHKEIYVRKLVSMGYTVVE
jgi:hypothetical protein